jgi:hypothetical protein
MAKGKWTPATLNAACYHRAQKKTAKFTIAELNACERIAESEYDDKTIESRVDLALSGYVNGHLHELLHEQLESIVGENFGPTLEEIIIHAIDRHMIEYYIRKHPTVMKKWQVLLRKKMTRETPEDDKH